MNDDWMQFAIDIGVGAVAGILLICVMFLPAILMGRI